MQCILHSVFCILFSMFCILNSILCILHSLICILGCMYSVFHTLFPMFCILYQLLCNFVLFCIHILQSAFCFCICILFSLFGVWGEDFNNSSTFSLPSLCYHRRKKLIYRSCHFPVSIQYSTVDEAMGANDPRIH